MFFINEKLVSHMNSPKRGVRFGAAKITILPTSTRENLAAVYPNA